MVLVVLLTPVSVVRGGRDGQSPLMRSDAAWRAGHLAARRVMRPLLIGAAVVAIVSVPAQLIPALYVVLLGLSLATTLAALVVGAVSASRAAISVPRDG